MRIVTLDNKSMENILVGMLRRDPNNYDSCTQTVQAIVNDAKTRGDEALSEYTKRFDGAAMDGNSIRVTREGIDEAMKQVEPGLLKVTERSVDNIRRYHGKQRQSSWFDAQPNGTILGQKVTALESVGVYVPGGKAAYPSSVLMSIIPTEVAGVKRIAMVTPPGKDRKVNPVTLTAAHMARATEVCKAGGAQAVAALAFGTASIPRANKIVGPGNIFVTLTKKAVYGHVSIDSIAGPSEILMIADDSANPRFVAADLLSQTEHDELIPSILVTTSMGLARKVSDEVDGFPKVLSHSDIIRKSLDNCGYVLVTKSMEKAVETANSIAPEHMEVVIKDPFEVMTKIQNAGAIFIGEYSSEPLGDYFAGLNHILPTNGAAKFFSPLGVDDFIKKSSIIYYSREALETTYRDIETFAESEHLAAYANSVKVRFGQQGGITNIERTAFIIRDTSETHISMTLNLDGSGRGNISTGIGFLDHMLNSFARRGLSDLDLTVKGDLEVNTHHTIEDTGTVLGQAIRKAAGDKKGIMRYGSQTLPMDESLVFYALDLCGKPYLVCDLVLDREKAGSLETEMMWEFFYVASCGAEMNLRLKQLSGTNNHHIIEVAFKAFAKALNGTMAAEPRLSGVLSTKGSLQDGGDARPVPEDDNTVLHGHTAVCHDPVPGSGWQTANPSSQNLWDKGILRPGMGGDSDTHDHGGNVSHGSFRYFRLISVRGNAPYTRLRQAEYSSGMATGVTKDGFAHILTTGSRSRPYGAMLAGGISRRMEMCGCPGEPASEYREKIVE